MKTFFAALIALLVVVACLALDKTKINPDFEKAAKCQKLCDDKTYKPICATDGKSYSNSFMNECVLKKYNCENNKNLVKKSDGECAGGMGIRL